MMFRILGLTLVMLTASTAARKQLPNLPGNQCGPKKCNIWCDKMEICWKDTTIACRMNPCCPLWSCKTNVPCRIPARYCRAKYDPVCGVDGCIYENHCEAKRHGVKIQCKGECPCKQVPKPCDQPKGVEGPCEGWFPRWTYDKVSRKCEKFFYGGCKGNMNNFKTKAECERKCGSSIQGCSNDQICDVWYPPNWTGPRVTPDVESCPSECDKGCRWRFGRPPRPNEPEIRYCLDYTLRRRPGK